MEKGAFSAPFALPFEGDCKYTAKAQFRQRGLKKNQNLFYICPLSGPLLVFLPISPMRGRPRPRLSGPALVAGFEEPKREKPQDEHTTTPRRKPDVKSD